MKDEFSVQETCAVLDRQLNSFWPVELSDQFYCVVDEAVQKTKRGWDDSVRSYYLSRGFSVLNTSVYAVFLYNLAHRIGSRGDTESVQLADKLYYLNKIMNGVEWYWNTQLPDHFIVEHPLGSVLGKGDFGDHFSIYQGVTIGERLSKDVTEWPRLGNYVTMFAHSSVIGNCHIGNWVILSAYSRVMNQDIPDCSIVFGSGPNLTIKTYDDERIIQYFTKSWNEEIMKKEFKDPLLWRH